MSDREAPSATDASSPSADEHPHERSLDEAWVKSRVRARLLGKSSTVYVDRFELLGRLGQGSEGTVYEARDRRDGAHVALKQLHPTYAAKGGSLKREFRALADLVHANLVTLHELFHVGSQRFYTMELVPGIDFITYVRSSENIVCYEKLRSTLPQLFAGLDALHRAGKVHRDLKPSNVLVRADGHLVILDYGLVLDALTLDDFGGTDPTACTPAFAAPEQISGNAVAASDLYAVGAMLFCALTGQLPFGGSPATQIAQKRVAHLSLTPPRTIDPTVPEDLDSLCLALLAHDPAERPTAAVAQKFCTGELTELRAPPEPQPEHESAPPETFVGRRALLSELHVVATSDAKQPRTVLLHGESGIGKSALIRRFCAERAAAGALVLSGRCYEREHLPYKVLDPIAERLVWHLNALPEAKRPRLSASQRAALLRLFPAFERLRLPSDDECERTAQADAAALRQQAFVAVRALFRALALHREVVFALDDLQWIDLDSIDLLQQVLSGIDAPPILLIAVTRTVELDTSQLVQALRGLASPSVRRVEIAVGPLAPDEAAELLDALLPSADAQGAAQRDAYITQASGVPFALHQLAEHARYVGLPSVEGRWLGEVIRLRARRCSPDARRLLDVLAVAGRPLETSLALESAGASSAAFFAAAELCARKLARFRDAEHERCLEPYHDLVRSAVTEAIGPVGMRAIHRDIVAALSARASAHPEHLVEHLLGAEELERAGLTALGAAERASAQFAWNRAAELLVIAQRVLPPAELRTHDAYARLAFALAAANRHREAASAYEAAAREALSPRARLECAGLAAQQQMRAGDLEGGVARFDGLLAELGYHWRRSEPARYLQFLLARARLRIAEWWHGFPAATAVRSQESTERLQLLATAYAEVWVRDPLRSSLLHAWMAREAVKARDHFWLRSIAGEIGQQVVRFGVNAERRCATLLAELDRCEVQVESAYDAVFPQLAHAMHELLCRWRPLEALRAIEAADELFARHCPGTVFERSWIGALREWTYEITGDTDRLLASFDERERTADSRDDGYTREFLVMAVPMSLMLRDQPEAAIAYLAQNWQLQKRPSMTDYTAVVRVSTAHLYRGDAEAAHRCLLDAWWSMQRAGLFSTNMIRENAEYHRARNAVGLYWHTRDRALRREARHYLRRMRRYPPVLRAAYRMIEASLAWADSDLVRCRAALEASIAESAEYGAGSTEWCGRYRLAELDGDAKALAEADAWFRARAVSNPARWVHVMMPGGVSAPAAP